MNNVQLLRPELMERATVTLERAFSTDPMFKWIFPDPAGRSQSLRHLVRVPIAENIVKRKGKLERVK